MSERDDTRHLAVGGGSPADPDHGAGEPVGGEPARAPRDPERPLSAGDVVQAVAAFVDDLIEPGPDG